MIVMFLNTKMNKKDLKKKKCMVENLEISFYYYLEKGT